MPTHSLSFTTLNSVNERIVPVTNGIKNAIRNAILTANTGDIVAIIGKGHERYNIDKNGYHDFEIIKEALRERRNTEK
mgnify:CR=1 FL=1